MTEVNIGRIQSKFVQPPYGRVKVKVSWQEVAVDNLLLMREYQITEPDPERKVLLTYEPVEILPPGNYFVLRQPLVVNNYLPGRPRTVETVSSTFDYWRKQTSKQNLVTYYEDLLVATVTWTWRLNAGTPSAPVNPPVLEKVISISNGELLGAEIPYESPTLFLTAGQAPAVRGTNIALLQSATIDSASVLGQLGETVLMSSDQIRLERRSELGVVVVSFYGTYYQELPELVSLEDNGLLGHVTDKPLRERVYPPGLSVPDYYNDAEFLYEQEGQLYYRLSESGVEVGTWAGRPSSVGIVGNS